MTDRLHQELLAVTGLEQLTVLQLQDLSWKTREQILIALFHEHASSTIVAEEMRVKSRDRRLERKTEKAENAERDVMRKNEERFRSELMQIAATELARLGAPTMVTWQKLVYDRDCCAQAFRILLTKIKSSKRSANSSSSGSAATRPPIALARRLSKALAPADEAQSTEGDYEWNVHASRQATPDEPATETVLPRMKRLTGNTMKTPLRQPSRTAGVATAEWNTDTRFDDVASSQADDERLEPDGMFGSSEMSIQRTKIKSGVSASTSAFAAKLKRSQLHSLQQENGTLADENAALRQEIAHLEELVATLQAENNQTAVASQDALHPVRLKLLQAQNMQLQRHIGLLQDAMHERELAESMLFTSLSQWRELIEFGRDEARAAGADSNAKTKDGKPVQWMMAVPERLLDELVRVESQIDHAKKMSNRAQESKLRVGGAAAEFVKHASSSAVSFADLYVPGVAHLRVERVKTLEGALVKSLRSLEAMHELVIQSTVPRMTRDGPGRTRESTISAARCVEELLASLRRAVMEIGAFGVVVPSVKMPPRTTASSSSSDQDQLQTVAQVLRAYTAAAAATSGVSAKDREKQLKTMLKQLQASESAVHRENTQLQKEAKYWKDAWASQEQLLRTLIQRVRSVGDKKIQWAKGYLVHPLRELQEVWTSFRRTQSQQDQRIHKNAYLPLLIDTLQQHEPVLCIEAIEQWHQYASRYNLEIGEILDDYDANCTLLKSYLDPPVGALDVASLRLCNAAT